MSLYDSYDVTRPTPRCRDHCTVKFRRSRIPIYSTMPIAVTKKTKIPRERNETVRQELLQLLDGNTLNIHVISKVLGISEKDIYGYLSQLNETNQLSVIPAECVKCGYKFENRKKVKKPSKCPSCKSTYIKQPEYTLRK